MVEQLHFDDTHIVVNPIDVFREYWVETQILLEDKKCLLERSNIYEVIVFPKVYKVLDLIHTTLKCYEPTNEIIQLLKSLETNMFWTKHWRPKVPYNN